MTVFTLTDKSLTKQLPCTYPGCVHEVIVNKFYTPSKARCPEHEGKATQSIRQLVIDPSKQPGAVPEPVVPNLLSRNQMKSEYMKARRDAMRAVLNQFKDQPCMDCNVRFPPRVMDFHHRDEKDFALTKDACGGRSIHAVLAEIEKCDLLCACCHRLRHGDADLCWGNVYVSATLMGLCCPICDQPMELVRIHDGLGWPTFRCPSPCMTAVEIQHRWAPLVMPSIPAPLRQAVADFNEIQRAKRKVTV